MGNAPRTRPDPRRLRQRRRVTIKATDPNHLVSLGVIGGGQCGAEGGDFELVHASSAIDLCSYHDYGAAAAAIPGDQWNGLALRLQQCRNLDKPLISGESGLTLAESGGTATARAEAFRRKMTTSSAPGSALLLWAGSPHPTTSAQVTPHSPSSTPALGVADDGGDDDTTGSAQDRLRQALTTEPDHRNHPAGQGRHVVVLDAQLPTGSRSTSASAHQATRFNCRGAAPTSPSRRPPKQP